MAVPAVAGTPIVLEDGVEVSFDVDPAGGDFRAGDYWVFAARTADASVEKLDEAPPRGTLHHYCRLAVVTFPSTVVDCRTLWPPDCEDCDDCVCDVCVTPESHASGTLTIQMAVDKVKATGGKVCLQTGFYFLDTAVRITGATSLTVQGKGWRTILVSAGREPAIVVQASLGVTIDSLTVVTSSDARPGETPTGIAIWLRNTIGTRIERCVLAQLGSVQRGEDTTAQPTGASAGARLGRGPRFAGSPLIALDGILVETVIRENVLVGTTGIGSVWGALHGEVGFKTMKTGAAAGTVGGSSGTVSGYVLTLDFAVAENLLLTYLTGVSLEGFTISVGVTRVTGNSIHGGLRAGIVCNGLTLPTASIVDVTSNLVQVYGFGIAVGTDDTRVVDNDVYGLFLRRSAAGTPVPSSGGGSFTSFSFAATAVSFRRADGIVLVPSIRPSGIDRCQVRGNRVLRVLGHAIAVRTEVRSGLVSHNMIQGIGGDGITMQEGSSARTLTVEGNQILDVGAFASPEESAFGIRLENGVDVSVLGNTVHGVRGVTPVSSRWFGIFVNDCLRARVADNDVGDIGIADPGGGQGIVVVGRLLRADVVDNSVRRSNDPSAKLSPSTGWHGVVMIADAPQEVVELGDVTELAPHADFTELSEVGRVLGTRRMFARRDDGTVVLLEPAHGRAAVLPRRSASVAVQGNLVEGVGSEPAVLISTRGSCAFSDNRCFHDTRRSPVVEIFAGALVASDNYVEGSPKQPAILMQVPSTGAFTVSGNIASGMIAMNGAALPAPWDQLNVP